MSNQSRRPKGQPVGGQFAANDRSPADIALTRDPRGDRVDALTALRREFPTAETLHFRVEHFPGEDPDARIWPIALVESRGGVLYSDDRPGDFAEGDAYDLIRDALAVVDPHDVPEWADQADLIAGTWVSEEDGCQWCGHPKDGHGVRHDGVAGEHRWANPDNDLTATRLRQKPRSEAQRRRDGRVELRRATDAIHERFPEIAAIELRFVADETARSFAWVSRVTDADGHQWNGRPGWDAIRAELDDTISRLSRHAVPRNAFEILPAAGKLSYRR